MATSRISSVASHLSAAAADPHPIRRLDEPDLILSDLKTTGFVAVQVIEEMNEIEELRSGIYDFIEGLNPGAIDRNDPSTWTAKNWPTFSRGLYHRHGAGHSAVAWRGRTHPGVLKAYSIIWGTHELITSYDAVGYMRPPEVLRKLGEEPPKQVDWSHIDHDDKTEEVELIQGFLNLWESGPEDGGLVQWLRSGPDYPKNWPQPLLDDLAGLKIFGMMKKENIDAAGYKRVKVCGRPGTMFFWMSTQIHCNEVINPNRSLSEIRPRGGLYICMCPRQKIRPSQLYSHVLAYKLRITTGHRPYRVVGFRQKPRLMPGQFDPIEVDRIHLKEHEVNETVLRLVGALPYPGGEGEAYDLDKLDLSKLDMVWQS